MAGNEVKPRFGVQTVFAVVTLIALLGAAAQGQGRACSLAEIDADKDGQIDRLILENAYLSLTLSLSQGGQGTSLIYRKTGKELTLAENGLFLDQEWAYAQWPSDYQNLRYHCEIKKNTPEQVTVSLSGRGMTEKLFFIKIVKTISLFKDRNGIRVDYEAYNVPDSQTTIRHKGWVHNVVDVRGEKKTYYVPSVDGIVREKGDTAPGRPDRWVYNPSRGWTGMVSEGGTGAVGIVEYKLLKCFYNWYATGTNTMEWRYMPVDIPSGKSFTTTFWVVPFSGLKSIEGATENVVGSIRVQDTHEAAGEIPVSVDVYSAVSGAGQVLLRARRLPEKKWRVIGRKSVPLVADAVVKVSLPYNATAAGTHVVNAQVVVGGKVVGEFEKPVIVGKASMAYRQAPLEERVDVEAQEAGTRVSIAVRDSVVTPHIKWARPYHKGRTKALFLVECWGQREVVELAQRMDLDYTVPTIFPTSDAAYGPGTPWEPVIGKKEAFQLVDKALDAEYDVIVLGDSYSSRIARVSLDRGKFPKTVWQKILAKVKAGTGLIVVDPYQEKNWKGVGDAMRKVLAKESLKAADHGAFVTAGIPFDALPALSDGAARTGTYGQGRIVALDYKAYCLTPATYVYDRTFRFWEYYHSLFAKCVLWAAKKEPVTRIASMKASAGEGGLKVRLSMSNDAPETPLGVAIQAVDSFDALEAESQAAIVVPKGAGAFSFDLPGSFKSGLHFVSVTARDKAGKVVDWGTASVTVTNAAGIAGITLDRESYEPGQTVRAKVALSGELDGRDGLRVVAELVDNYDRIQARVAKDVGGLRELSLEFTLDRPLTLLQRVKCTLMEGDRTLAAARKEFTVPEVNRLRKGFFSKVWLADGHDAGSYLAVQRIERLRDMGFDMMNGSDARSRMHRKARLRAEANVQVALENMTSDLASRRSHTDRWEHAKKTNSRKRCFSDPAYRKDLKSRIQGVVRTAVRYNPDVYSLEDEPGAGLQQFDFCYSQYCLPRFRKALADEYGTLAALNAEWGTEFATWESVRPMTRQQVRGRGNYAPWADHHAFMDTVYAEAMQSCRDWIQEIDPTALVGVSGINPMPCHYGFWGDWWKLMQSITYLDTYGARIYEAEIPMSFAPEAKVSRFIGYGRNEVIERNDVWRMFLCGEDGIAFWYERYLVNPDLTYSYFAGFMRKIIAELCHSGIGDLITSAERRHDGIAIHYSEASAQAAFITGKQKFYEANLFKWLANLKAIGLQARFVSYEQIEKGELIAGGYKALILPYSIAISDEEAKAIKGFVRRGGLVIADVQAAMMDEHCKRREAPALASLFGVSAKDARVDARTVRVRISGPYGGLTPAGKGVSAAYVETGLKATKGRALGRSKAKTITFGELKFSHAAAGSPLLVANRYGKGKSLYLGISGSALMYDEAPGSLLEDTLAWAAVAAGVKVEDGAGKRLYRYELSRFKVGEAEYVGIMPDISLAEGVNLRLATPDQMAGKGRETVVRFGRTSHLYDMRRKTYHGLTDRVAVRAVPGVAMLYGMMRSEIRDVKLSAAPRCARGETLEYRGTVGAASGDYLVRVMVHGPDGNVRSYYGRRLTARAGRFKGRLPLALNEQTGKWRIVVTETVSGKKAERSFVVR